VKVPFYPRLHDFPKNIAFWKVPRLRLFVLPVKATCMRDEYGELAEMILTEKLKYSGEKKSVPVSV